MLARFPPFGLLCAPALMGITIMGCGPAGVPDGGAVTSDAAQTESVDGGAPTHDAGHGTPDAGHGTPDAGPSPERPPHILLVIADDVGVDAMGQYAYGDDVATTPVLDALAASGITFDNAWATPACTTTRGTLLTGQHGVHSGVSFVPAVLADDAAVLPALVAAGADAYDAAIFGKWHVGGPNPPPSHPNDVGVPHYAGNLTGVLGAYDDWTLTVDGVSEPSSAYHTSLITDLASHWIAERDDAPWFAWVAYAAPHSPFHLPPAALHTQNLSGEPNDIATNRRAYYLAMLESLDTELGRLLDDMPADVRDNTIIVFIGDNGTPGPVIDNTVFPAGHAKSSLYEGGLRVPMIISGGPVTRSGVREAALVHTADIFSTVMELSATSTSGLMLDGQSFAGLLTEPDAPARTFNYAEFESANVTGWAVRDATYKLIVFENGNEELYDVAADIAEVNNLIGDPSLIDRASTLRTYGEQVRGAVPPPPSSDITGAILTQRDANCAEYVANFHSTAQDVGRALSFAGAVGISLAGDKCVLASNAIPNHDFNDGALPFPNDVSEQDQVFSFPQAPTTAPFRTDLSLSTDNGVLLNGVKVDVLAAGCFGVGNGKIGCNDPLQPWRYDPMFSANGFRVDSHHAHAQPNGAYHYHGPPNALFSEVGDASSGLIGFAADGFPIFGSFFHDGTQIRRATSSYTLIDDANGRPDGPGEPGGMYDGTFRDDYEYVEGAGDLDACNGMTTPDGVYGYYITNTYPWTMACFTGTPDPSFNK